ncbi:MAG: hypothetical protein WKF43_00070 [Acidimicrobiales bacterium]
MTSPLDGPRGALAIPEGLFVDQSSRTRLAAQLALVGPGVSGVGAESRVLAPGASYRVASERAGLMARSEVFLATDNATHGAVLVRPGLAFEIRGDVVVVEGDELLIDRGAVAHDPWQPVGALQAASPVGRPPFPYRPVVVFLGFDPDPDLADWVRASVNGMVRGSTEGRIAVPEPTGGLHLTRPCSPTEESVAALAPDVIVALDPTAVELGARWLGRDRSAIVIELTQDTTRDVRLVSWRIGCAQGRLRARIGRGIGATALAELAHRLCAGPQPVPPHDRQHAGERVRLRHRRTTPASSVLVLMGDAPAHDQVRCAALADHTGAAATVELKKIGDHIPMSEIPVEADTADIVLVRALSRCEAVQDLVGRRREAGRVTVVDLGAGDLEWDLADPERDPVLTGQAQRLVQSSGAATTTSGRVRGLLHRTGVRAHVLPTLLSPARSASLANVREEQGGGGALLLGWHTGAAGTGSPVAPW